MRYVCSFACTNTRHVMSDELKCFHFDGMILSKYYVWTFNQCSWIMSWIGWWVIFDWHFVISHIWMEFTIKLFDCMKAIACQAEIYFQFDSFNHENYMPFTTGANSINFQFIIFVFLPFSYFRFIVHISNFIVHQIGCKFNNINSIQIWIRMDRLI